MENEAIDREEAKIDKDLAKNHVPGESHTYKLPNNFTPKMVDALVVRYREVGGDGDRWEQVIGRSSRTFLGVKNTLTLVDSDPNN